MSQIATEGAREQPVATRAIWLALNACPTKPSRRRLEQALQRGEKPHEMLLELVGQRRASGLLERAQQQIERLSQAGIRVLCRTDTEFPALLQTIPDPPHLLFFRGSLACLAAPTVAIVGARRAPRVGLEIAHTLAQRLAARGIVVVSGLAIGIDSAAHRGALSAQGALSVQGALSAGRSIAVLGSGIDCVQPMVNRGLARSLVAQEGLIISEYLPAQRAAPFHFPERNRLISGVSLGVIVVEAGERSGSLITARLALEQGREVMAVPGSLGHSNARGCHRLLKAGAALVEDERDVFDALDFLPTAAAAAATIAPAAQQLSDALARVLTACGPGATGIDEICAHLGQPVMQVSALLSELEVEGFVQRVPDGYIRRPFPPS
ncbi:MAG: DNA-processing protein DprA [Gammaproteobacteria bacterium]|nr:DNA-processing protein DprA [Gammaproteobacteria bacterium]